MSEDFFIQNIRDIENFVTAVPMPPKLYSAYSKQPFDTCVGCGQNLLEPPQFYEIQKTYKGKEVIFEYALCLDCGESLMKEYSQESKTSIERYFSENLKPVLFLAEDQCRLCQKFYEAEYSSMAICKGKNIFATFLICGTCTEHIESLLSEKTRRHMQEFIDTKFPGIPADFFPMPSLTV